MGLPAVSGGSWNPLRCGGTALPVPLLLMAKLIALAFLLTNHVRLLPDPFLPFLPVLDQLGPGHVFQRAVQTVFVVSAVGLLFNRRVRTCCLLLGGSVLLSVVASRAYYGNNKTFCALALVFAGLHMGGEPKMLRWQVALVYFGAGLNKALDPDWHSGQFFEHWAGTRLEQPVYIWLSAMLPPLVLGKVMCWTTIALELTASCLLTIPRTRLYGVCISILLQSGFLLFTGQTFTMFFFGMQAAMFAFLAWPEKKLEVIYDGDCGFCDWCREQIARFDLEGVFTWIPYQTGRGRALGISDAQASARLQLVTPGGEVLSGFLAVRRMALYLPTVWLVLCALIALAPAAIAPLWRRVIVGATLLLFTPLANLPGAAAYDFVARHRHRIFPGRTCKVPDATTSR
ncbi:MAG: DCC1-like thiol-disulfide oxidoreductase family protein [Bryobacteraceae bacterium]